MGITLSGQTGLLLTACLLGFVLGAVYDIFRVTRAVLRCGWIVIFVQDILFWIFCGCVTFVFLLFYNNGKIRALVIIAEAVGAALYYNTIGVIVIGKVKVYEKKVKRRVRIAAAAAITPVNKISRAAGRQIARGGRKTGSFFKKESNLLKIHLQVQRKMMYNLLRAAKKPKDDVKQ